VPLHQSYVA